MKTSHRKQVRKGLIHLVLLLGSGVMLTPLIWTVSTSLKTSDKITLRSIELIPTPVAWWNYIEIFNMAPIPLYFRNSMIVVIPALFGGIVMCSLTGYAFARIPFPGRDVLFAVLLATMMLPDVVRIIPLFVMFDRLGWVNTFWPLIVPRLLAHNAFYIFLFRQFFRGLPYALSDAARIDGCSEFCIWWRIMTPLSKPVLAVVAIFSFQFAWGDFLNPLIYLGSRRELWTLALGLSAFKSLEGQATLMNMMMVMSMMMTIPILIVFAIGQKYMIKGVTLSGLKG